MNREDLIYLAGFMDADGSFTFGKSNHDDVYRVNVHMCNTNRDVLEWAKLQFTGRISTQIGHGTQRKPMFYLYWRNEESRVLLPALIPFLRVKKRQAEIILEYLKMTENSRMMCMTGEQRNKRRLLLQECLILNHKGVDQLQSNPSELMEGVEE